MPHRAAFLDRDGVLIRDIDLLTQRSQVELYPGVPQALIRLHNSGLMIVVVSNQTVVARGLASEKDVDDVHEWINKLLQIQGAEVDVFYFCPHHPNATLNQYRVDCDCRKPRPGLLLRAARELDLNLAESFMVGDRPSDILAGQRAGCRTILVETGRQAAPPIESADMIGVTIAPDYVCQDLTAAVAIITGKVS